MSAENSVHQIALSGFGTTESTAAYERGRPTYNTTIVAQLIKDTLRHRHEKPLTLVDMAAGTGIFTRILGAHDAANKIIAVEPVAAMRQRLSASVASSLTVIDGTATHTTLSKASADAVFCAQSFHWFCNVAALNEFHRILKPNGGLAIIWNSRNRDVPFVDAIECIIDEYYTDETPRQQTCPFQQVFAECAHLFTPLQSYSEATGIVQSGDEQLMIDRVMSISVIAKQSEEERERIKQRISQILHTHPDTAGKTIYSLPYRTDAYWCYAKD